MQVVRRSVAMTAILTLSGLALAGCSTELSGFGSKPSAVAGNTVLSAPSGTVETAALPPPPVTTTGSIPAPAPIQTTLPGRTTTAASAITPNSVTSNVPLTPPAANPGANAYAASATDGQLAGAWQFKWDDGRNSCPLKLSAERGISSLAAQADISCPGEIFMTKGWSMMGSDIVLQNHQGKITARLSPDGPNRYAGELVADNQKVVLSR